MVRITIDGGIRGGPSDIKGFLLVIDDDEKGSSTTFYPPAQYPSMMDRVGSSLPSYVQMHHANEAEAKAATVKSE